MELEKFLYTRVYRHPNVLEHRARAQQMLREMFDWLIEKPDLLPPRTLARALADGTRRAVGDYLAGMTDRYAQREYERLIRPDPAG